MSRKEKMKIYHGIPKSVTDEHTVFYASFDYSKSPDKSTNDITTRIGNAISTLVDSCTGGGILINKKGNQGNDILVEIPNTIIPYTSDLTIEFFLKPSTLTGLICQVGYHDTGFFRTYTTKLTESITKLFKVNEFNHFRLTVNNGIVKYFVNGTKVNEFNADYTTGTLTDITKNLCIRIGGDNNASVFSMDELIISDLHISDIDRGDYFPNLPQDFIDGKAIIKPRMNQQQIKGDPLYAQVTELLVDSSAKLPKPYSNTPNSDGTYTHIYKPELSVLNANVWNSTSKLKIKGLNGEIISGVIDSDTALCKIVNYSGGSTVIEVDNSSRLQVGDTVRLYSPKNPSANWVVNVVSIDGNKIAFSSSLNEGYIGDYIVETTASSSSPIVKSEDGTTVVGTWSGLGTNEATFTLGTNTDLSGKDLYVTYSLNIPNGNSDFTELPYSVDRAYNEVGLEMKPVSEIVIEDDFRGKVQGDTKICPHVTKYAGHTSLKLPQEFSAECNQVNINDISTTDGSCGSIKMSSPGIPQQLFSFNLIEVVERKLGCEIPSRDKIQWIIDNTKNITFNWWGYGNSPTRNFAEYQWWRGNQWSNVNRLHTFPRITKGSIAFLETSNITELLRATNDGMIHFLVYTDASDGVTSSVIYTQYVDLEIILKTDSTFTTLYCDNKRAREDSCNPVLIQKETKTVKRYLPSKECFVTECSYSNPKNETRNSNEFVSLENNLASEKGNTLLTYGTGGRVLYGNNKLNGAIARLKPVKPSYYYTGENLLVNDSFDSNEFSLRYLCYQGDGMSYADNFSNAVVDTNKYLANNMLLTRCKLINVNGEVKLALYMADIINKKFVNELYKLYDLPNRPLIK